MPVQVCVTEQKQLVTVQEQLNAWFRADGATELSAAISSKLNELTGPAAKLVPDGLHILRVVSCAMPHRSEERQSRSLAWPERATRSVRDGITNQSHVEFFCFGRGQYH